MSLTDADVAALAAAWSVRARKYRREAGESENVRDINRLVGMASSWDFAARELCHTAGFNPNDGPPIANPEADRAQLEANAQLARDADQSQA